MFWQFGKIHGLENIAFCDAKELSGCAGNPYKLQKLVNKVTPESVPGFSSFDQVADDIQSELAAYKAAVDKMGLYPSDKKKLLSMPFYLSKRSEAPTLRAGQKELELFKALTGRDFHDNSRIRTDDETKITEFDYENYLNSDLLDGIDTQSDEFKQLVRTLNYKSKTQNEQFESQREEFAKLQAVLAGLNE